MSDRPITRDGDRRLAVLDYGIGNLRSAEKAFQHVGADAALTADPDEIGEADAVVLPGVGAFGRCREALHDAGLDEVALEAVASGRPFLGICVGHATPVRLIRGGPGSRAASESCPARCVRLRSGVKHPQMQWNRAGHPRQLPAVLGAGDRPWMYFVHSFAPEVTADVIATCDYGGEVTAAAQRHNVMATQFHPEKSSTGGLALLANFVRLAAGVTA